MRKTATTGSGITAKEHVQADGDDIKPLMQEIAGSWNAAGGSDFDRRMHRCERWALDVLARAGLEPNGVTNGTDDTPETYARRIINGIGFIRAFIARGDAAQAARFSVDLGIAMGEAGIKFQWEKHALSGLKTAGTLNSGRIEGAKENQRRAAERRKQWRSIASDIASSSNPKFAGYTLDDTIAYIQKQPCGKLKSGKPYATRTISDEIKMPSC